MSKLILAQVLKRKGVSKRQFAKRLGIRYENVFRLFHAGVDPRISALNKYAKALGVSARDLLSK